jgi:transcription elongation factor Elf1
MPKINGIVCPHCAKTSSDYLVTVRNGMSPQQCRNCRKSFVITMKDGSVYAVK